MWSIVDYYEPRDTDDVQTIVELVTKMLVFKRMKDTKVSKKLAKRIQKLGVTVSDDKENAGVWSHTDGRTGASCIH